VKSSEQSAGRRLGVATIDQAIAGASNVLIAVLAARILGVESFGLFAIVFLVYLLVQGTARALTSEPLLLHPAEAEERPGDAIGTGLVLGIGLGAIVVLGGLVAHLWDGRLGSALIALGVFVPLLVVQDIGRYLGFATRRPDSALTLDVTWLVLQLAGVAALVVTGSHVLWEFILAWAASGAAAGLVVFWQHRGTRIRLSLSWLAETWSYSWRYLISYTSTQGSGLLAAVLLGAIAGAKALGAVQGALLLQRPFMTLQVAVIASGVGEISRNATDREFVRRMVRKLTILTTAAGVLNGVVLLLLPDQVGRAVLGATWSEAQQLLWPAAVQIVLIGLMTGFRTGLLGMRAIHKAVVIDIVTTVLALVLSVGGALIGGAEPAMWGVAISQAVGVAIWLTVFWNYTSRDLEAVPADDVRDTDSV
jgi:O-antigen/teichoic acid export membrane protein